MKKSQELGRDGHGDGDFLKPGCDDDLFSQVYEELRRIARGMKRQRGGETWNPTALVNEAYVRLADGKAFQPTSVPHLKYTMIRAMRFVLVELARRNAAIRRGGGGVQWKRVPLDDRAAQSAAFDPREILAVSIAIDQLMKQNEMQARAIECQFFGGLEVAEIAAVLEISEKKVQRSLRMAKAKLAVALRERPSDD